MALPDHHSGRDPVRHIVFSSVAQADAYTGNLGQPFYVVDNTALVVQHRIGDGTQGGQLIASNVMSTLPANIAKVVNLDTTILDDEVDAAVNPNGGTVITHNLGAYPVVQVLDLALTPAGPADVDIEHIDQNTLKLTASPQIDNARVLLR
jgi:hypothetical protein